MANVLETMIKVGAVWTGAAAVAQAAAGMQKVEKSGLLANLSFMKMAKTLAAFGLGWKGVEKFSEFLKEGITDARGLTNAQEKLNMVLEGNKKAQAEVAKMHGDSAAIFKHNEEALHSLSLEMEKTGLAASTLEATWAGAMKAGFGPAQIEKNSQAFQGLVTKLYGIKASSDDASAAMNVLRLAIQGGPTRSLVQAGVLTVEESKHLKKMGSEAERAAFMMQKMGSYTSLTGKIFNTTAGQVERAHRNWEELGRTLGGPLAKSQDAFTIALGNVAKELMPIAEQLVPKMTVVLNQLVEALNKSGPYVQQFGQYLGKAFDWLLTHWQDVVTAIISIVGAIATLKTILGMIGIFNKVTTAIINFQRVVSSIPAVLGILSNPITLTILAIAALAVAIYWLIKHWDQVKAVAIRTWDAIKNAWSGAAAWFQSIFAQIASATQKIWEPLKGPLTRLWTEIQPIVQYIVASFATLPASLQWIWDNVVVSAASRLKDLITVIAPYAQQAFQNWLTSVGWVSKNIIAPIIDGFVNIAEKLKVGDLGGAFQAWLASAQQIGHNIVDLLVQAFQTLAPKIAAVIGPVYDAVIKPFVDAYNFISGLFAQIGATITNAVTSAVGAAQNVNIMGWKPFAQAQKKQMGGLVSSPTLTHLAEKGIPEMVVPIEGTSRSRGLLSSAASMIGMQGAGRGMGVGGGDTNVNVSMPITITGVQSGQEGAVGREVQRAMQDPIRQLLDQLKKAKQEEGRLSYA